MTKTEPEIRLDYNMSPLTSPQSLLMEPSGPSPPVLVSFISNVSLKERHLHFHLWSPHFVQDHPRGDIPSTRLSFWNSSTS